MQSNRELLEAAAKAGGIEGEYVSWCLNGFKEGIRKAGDTTSIPWNPLATPLHAFLLQTKLLICVNFCDAIDKLVVECEHVRELYDEEEDVLNATMRAITREAAVMSQQMP